MNSRLTPGAQRLMVSVLLSVILPLGRAYGQTPSSASKAGGAAGASVPLEIRDKPGSCELKSGNASHDIDLKSLQTDYNKGAWGSVQAKLADFLEHLRCPSEATDFRLDTRAASFSVLLLNDAPTLPTPTLVRIVVHRKPSPDLYSLRIVGPRLYNVSLLPPNSGTAVITSYSASATPNPVSASIAKVLGTVSSALPQILDVVPGIKPAETGKKYSVHEVVVPRELKRSQITVVDTTVADQETTAAANDTAAQAARLAGKAGELAAEESKPAGGYPGQLAVGLVEDTRLLAQKAGKLVLAAVGLANNPAGDAATLSADVANLSADTGSLKADEGALRAYAVSKTPTPSPVGLKIAGDAAKLAQDAGKLVSDAGKARGGGALATTTNYSFAPLTHLDFGLGTAAILSTSMNQRVKTNSAGVLVDDTPSGILTFAALNWHPVGYDESRTVPSPAERFRVIGGVALTPAAGIVAGVGYGWRNVQFQVGYGVLLTDVLRKGDNLKAPPIDESHPTRRGALGALFAGIEYTFQ